MLLNEYILIIIPFIFFIICEYFIKSIKENLKTDKKKDNKDLNSSILVNFPCEQLEYYKFLREEIKREDEITHQRLTWGITFQGFLISAMAVLLVFRLDVTIGVLVLIKITILAIGIIGITVSILTFSGVLASRNSIRQAVEHWKFMNETWNLYPNKVPQACGQGETFNRGTLYAEQIPIFFARMWCLFIISYVSLFYYFEIKPCIHLEDILFCVYEITSG